MFFGDFIDFNKGTVAPSNEMYKKRRDELIENVRKDNRDLKRGLILLFANFARDNKDFDQEPTFFYYSGIINESGCVIALEFDEKVSKSTLFVPNCFEYRKLYLGHAIEPTEENAKKYCFDKVDYLGDKRAPDIYLYSEFEREECNRLLDLISKTVENEGVIFVTTQKDGNVYVDSKTAVEKIKNFSGVLQKKLQEESIEKDKILKENSDFQKDGQKVGIDDLKKVEIKSVLCDISEKISDMRRKKDIYEITKITDALSVTALAHETAARSIAPGISEKEIQAKIEYIFTVENGKKAYETVVGSGKNATVLHYFGNNDSIKDGDLVLIDAGVCLDGYCSDITRTYPANGKFTEEQIKFYSLVLAAQKYIASIAKPGMYFFKRRTSEGKEDQSNDNLVYLTKKFLSENGGFNGKNFVPKEKFDGKQKGLGEYMTHGIGHFMGLDVHDAGDRTTPLKEGDVITIEPGVYIPEINMGIRIEDNYWITKNGAVCLSDMIPKEPHDIEKFMKDGLNDIEVEKMEIEPVKINRKRK